MRRLAVPLLLVPLALAGCIQAPPENGAAGVEDDEAAPHQFGGTFDPGYTREDVLAVCEAAKPHNPTCAMMESYPEQYRFGFPSRAACEEARAKVLAIPNTADVGACVETTVSRDPKTPTGSGATGSEPAASPGEAGNWSFRGTFSDDYRFGDEHAVCEASGHEECLIMESLPPQYAFTYATRAGCEEARAKVLAAPRVAGVTGCERQPPSPSPDEPTGSG